jgi:hypothetical protein
MPPSEEAMIVTRLLARSISMERYSSRWMSQPSSI